MAPQWLDPACRRITEHGLAGIVAGHREEPGIDLSLLAPANAGQPLCALAAAIGLEPMAHHWRPLGPVAAPWLDIVNATPRHTAEYSGRMPVRVKQHLVGLQRIGPQQKGPAV